MGRRSIALGLAASLSLLACSGSDGTDVDPDLPSSITTTGSIGAINGPAAVDPEFDPFATAPSAPTPTDGG